MFGRSLPTSGIKVESGEVSVLLVPRLDRLARKLTIQEAALAHVWKHGAV
jgi:DNA invertase Pin-like site-specific DNA recombinase